MEKSLSLDRVHSTILTSLQKLRVPDCGTSGSVTLNFWSMLIALNLLHIHSEGEGKDTPEIGSQALIGNRTVLSTGFSVPPRLCGLHRGTQKVSLRG